MAVSPDYLQYVLEQLAGLGTVTSRRMFGGIGLYCDALFFGLIADDTLYFKVDDSTRPDYESRGMRAFRPNERRPQRSLNYYALPVDALEDAEECLRWARRALAVAAAAPRR